MYKLSLGFHSLNRYLLLLLLVVVIVNSLLKWINKKNFSKQDNFLSLALMIDAHIQLLLGLVLYGSSSLVNFNSIAMKIPMVRYWTAEHVVGMIVVIALITLGRVRSKKIAKVSGNKAHLMLLIYNILAIALIIIVLIPSGRRII